MAPAGEVNAAYAPNVPPAATRTQQAIVEVHFDVVEGVKAIDPIGTQYDDMGLPIAWRQHRHYRHARPDHPRPRGRHLRFTLTNRRHDAA